MATSTAHHFGMTAVRGIANYTTSCHVSSALLILYHCVTPVRDALLQAELRISSPSCSSNAGPSTSSTCDEVVFQTLCDFVRDYYDDACRQEQSQQALEKPTKLYQALSHIGIHSESLGDAVTTLAKLLQFVRFDCPDRTTKQLASAGLDGTVHSVLRRGVQRKILPSRPMSCPFVVRRRQGCNSLEDALLETLQPTVLQGYQWSEDNGEVHLDSDDPQRDPTTKTLVLDQLPPIWMIQLDCSGQKRMEPLQPKTIHVPLSLSSPPFLDYELTGGIVYIEDDAEEKNGCDEDAGHTVAVIRDSEEQDNTWYLVDDELVSPITSDTACNILGGICDDRGLSRGLLWVYQRRGWAWSEFLKDATTRSSHQQSTSTAVDWERPSELVGRRVQVQWKGGIFFAGTISSYDHESGKHTVSYDDGDQRPYRLNKKTLEWL